MVTARATTQDHHHTQHGALSDGAATLKQCAYACRSQLRAEDERAARLARDPTRIAARLQKTRCRAMVPA